MFPDAPGPAETAIGFTDQFADAAVAKLDALFGAGYAQANPVALAAYVAACASNLNAFMTAVMEDDLDEALASFEETLPRDPEPRHRGRRR
jgi:hypothetical protein